MYKKLIITLVFLCAWITQTFASHFMGADLTYQCVGPCTYRITQSVYLDCQGTATQSYLPVSAGNAFPISTINFTFPSGSTGCTQPTPIGTGTFVSWAEVTPICPTITTACNLGTGAFVNGVVGATYFQDYNFCNILPSCSPVCVVLSPCCRNYAITSGATNNIEVTTCIDLNMSPCNSSPTFNNPPVPYICAGQPFTFSQGAYDPDGDSLSYALGPCYSGPNIPVTYNAGYSAATPLGSTWSVNVNPTTGDVTFTPNPTGIIVVAVMCIEIKEWRYINGTWVNIGKVSRDMQITVIPCTITNPQVDSIASNTLGGIPTPALGPYETFACAGSQVCFDIPIANLTAGANYTMYWNHNIPSGTFSDASNPFVIDTIFSTTPVAHFCWTPALPGTYSFLVTVKDDHCPIPGSSQRTIVIHVNNGLAGSQAVASYISCNDVQFVAFPGGNSPGPFTYSWSGPGNLSGNPNNQDSLLTNHYPNLGPYPWTLNIQDTFGCKAAVNGTINIVNGAVADAGPDVSMCSGYQFQLGTAPIAGQNYQWSASPGWTTATTISNPTFSLVNNGTTPITYNLTLQASNFGCTTFDYTTITVNPTPAVNITPNTPTICEGDSITLFATGGTSYLWNNGLMTNSITVAPNQNSTYSVVSFVNGCSSLPTFETVTVLHGPSGQISGTMGVCSGQGTVLTCSAGPTSTFNWGPIPSTGPTLNIPNIQQNTPVWMIPSNGGCPGDTVKAEVVVYAAPVPNFTSTTVCSGTPTFFNNLSSISTGNIISWAWNFNDPVSGANNVSNAQVPTHTFVQNGTYQTTLVATSENGCVSTITQPVTVTAVPVANFTFNNVCVGTPMTFTNQSTIATGNSIVAYSWDFGDGIVDNSNTQNPSHTYTDYNVYNATLTVVSNNGCVDRYSKTVFVYPAPVSDFEFETNCLVDGANFTATPTVPNIPSTSGIDYVQNFDWNFGDPTTGANNISINKDPYHKFTAGGQYPVTLKVTTNHGCVNTTTEFVTVYYQPIAEFTVNDRCANQVAKFVNQSTADPSTPLIGYNWSFGANNVPSFTVNPVFNYGLYGPNSYTATLIVTTSEACKDTVTHLITINPVPDPKFIASSECFGNTTTFQNTSSIKSGNIVSFNWQTFGDNSGATSPDTNATHVYTNWGTFTATLQAVSDSGCVDKQNQQVVVFAPPIDPIIVNDTVCTGNAAILDLHLDGKDKSNWYLTDTDANSIHLGDSYVTLPLSQTTTFYVDVVTPYGCRSVNRFPLTAYVFSDAEVNITASEVTVQLPANTVTFNTLSPVALTSWSWTFGDGFSSTVASPVHEYQYGDHYNVILRSIDENGCPHVSSKVIEVKRVVNLSVPSAFTPNGDGVNDYFQVGIYNVAAFNIRIYNRWGALVFESSNPGFEWDGKDRNGKTLGEGVYVVVTKIKAFDGGEEEQSSTVTIMK